MKPRTIPVWTYKNHKWSRCTEKACVCNLYVECSTQTYLCQSAKDILGVESYYYKEDGVYHLFDFSASHLCRNQLKRFEVLCK